MSLEFAVYDGGTDERLAEAPSLKQIFTVALAMHRVAYAKKPTEYVIRDDRGAMWAKLSHDGFLNLSPRAARAFVDGHYT